MKPWAGLTGLCLMWSLGGGAGTAVAAWDNVFQVCCHNCRSRPVVSYSAPVVAAACPQISYVQRCYYEPVTTTRTSYYYEPVTSYKYTTYYDPCTGCPQKVCQPCTSYHLRSKCNSGTSYVERCAMVPVTTLPANARATPSSTSFCATAVSWPPPHHESLYARSAGALHTTFGRARFFVVERGHPAQHGTVHGAVARARRPARGPGRRRRPGAPSRAARGPRCPRAGTIPASP